MMKIQGLKNVFFLLLIISATLCAFWGMQKIVVSTVSEESYPRPARKDSLKLASSKKSSFPVLCKFKKKLSVESANRIKEIPLKNRSIDIITSTNFTRVTILGKSVYNVCDPFLVKIEARDDLGREKTYGGDVFRVKLYSQEPYSAVNADSLEDYGNGTYLATFHMLWEGSMELEVLLVNSAEALPLFSPTIKGDRAKCQTYYGEFKSTDVNGKQYTENRDCSERKFQEPYCNFSDPINYAPWYCLKPTKEHLNCSHWTAHRQHVPALFKNLRKDIKDKFDEELLQRTRKIIHHQLGTIKVQKCETLQSLESNGLPYCKAEGPPPLGPNGYFFNDTWWPFDCKVHPFTSDEIRTCLRGKTVRIFGDSTALQFYTFLGTQLSCKTLELPPPRKTNNRERRCQANETILHFHFHGLPNGHGSSIPSWANHYTASEIDKLDGGPNLIVLVSHWAHFSIAGIPFFEQRMKAVRAALLRLKKRAPSTSIVIKGANTRDYRAKEIILVSSDWHSYQQEITLREIFKNDTSFGYLDSWELTQAQKYPDNTHPKENIIRNLNNRFMTYVCMDSMTKK